MLVLFSLACLFATVPVSYGQVGCPGNAQVRLMNCMGPIQAYLQSGPQEKQALCGQARDGLQCARDVISECEAIENSPLQQMVQGFSMVEGDINSNCNEIIPEPFVTEAPPVITEAPPVVTESFNEISVCGKKERRTLLRCSRKLQRFAAETPIRCGRVRRAMDCMSTLLEKCRSSIRGKTVAKVESLRGNLMGLCVETNEVDNVVTAAPVSDSRTTLRPPTPPVSDRRTTLRPPPPPVSEITTTLRPPPVGSGCPPNLSEKIQECMVPIQNAEPSLGKAAVCRSLNSGMTCLDELVSRCSSEPGFNDVVRMIDQTRLFVTSQCSGSGTNLGIGESGECSENVVDRLQGCTNNDQPFPGANQAERCREMNNALQCVDDIFEQCGHIPAIETLNEMMNLDGLRDIVRDHCSGNPVTIPETGGITNENCPSNYQEELQSCSASMQTLTQSNSDPALACSVATDGLGCIAQLLNDCGGKPEVRIVQSSLNLEAMQGQVEEQCAPFMAVSNGTNTEEDNCPPKFKEGIMECVKPMETISELRDMQLMCSEMTKAMVCVQSYIESCSNKPEIQSLTQAMNFDRLRSMVQSRCGVGNDIEVEVGVDADDTCPSGYLLKLTDCSNKMRQFMESGDRQNKQMACSVARDGFGCIRQLFADCSHKSEIKAFGEMFDLEEVHQMVEKECSSVVPMPNDSASARSCKYKDPGSQLLECNRLMNKFNNKSLKFKKRCRLVFKGFNCFEELIARCPTEKKVVKFTSMVNLDQARGALKNICPA